MPLWKVEQAAEYLGIRPKTLYEWVRLGRVPHRKIGFNVRFDPDELRDWTASQSSSSTRGKDEIDGARGDGARTPEKAPESLRRLVADAAQTLRDLERDVGASLSYPQRRRLRDLAVRLDEAVGLDNRETEPGG